MKHFSCCLLAFSLSFPSLALADEVPATHLDVGAEGALLQASYKTADWRSVVGLSGSWHLSPYVHLGARFLTASRSSTSSDTADRGDGYYQSWHLDVRAELHARPRATIDPWLGAGFGPYASWNYTPGWVHRGQVIDTCLASARCWSAEGTADLGIDLHFVSGVTLGLFWSARLPVGRLRTPEDRADIYPLFPSFRALFAF